MHQEPEKTKAAIKAAFPGRLGFGKSDPRIRRFSAEGTVASPARLPYPLNTCGSLLMLAGFNVKVS